MTVEDNFSTFGAGGLLSNEFFIAQVGLFAVTVLLFAGAVALCMMAMRTAGSARRTQEEARALFASLESQTAGLSALSDKMERASADFAERHEAFTAQMENQMRLQETAPEPPKERQEGPVVRKFDHVEDHASLQAEDEAEEADERPSALLRGLFRRR